MRITDDTLATNAIFRNNVNLQCLKVDCDYFRFLFINDYNSDKLDYLEEAGISFEVGLEDIHFNGTEYKCVLEFDDIETEDDKFNCIVCTLEKRKSFWDCDDVRDYNVDLIQTCVKQEIMRLSCKYIGVHIVADWERGSSDAVVLPLYRKQDFIREFPEANESDVSAFYDGRRDGFVCRKWKDDNGEVVTDTAYFATDHRIDDPCEILIEDEKSSLTISMKIEPFFKGEK